MKRIVFTVTNDLNYDQRMQRICTSLSHAGYDILLVGRKLKSSTDLLQQPFSQKKLQCFFNKTFLFYAEYNIRLFLFLFFVKCDAVCAIDLDTILPVYFISILKRKKRIYDAHELFTEMKEVVTRPRIKKAWLQVEKFTVPKFKNGYTVSHAIAEEFLKRYKVKYDVIRNMPYKVPLIQQQAKEKNIIYQGAINEARGLEFLIVAMKKVDAKLYLYGDGNLYDKIKALIKQHKLQHKIFLKEKLLPQQLQQITQQSYIGINLVEPIGLNQIYSLANKFFDYIQAAVPQVTMNFPEYKKINEEYNVAVLINTVEADEIAYGLNLLLNDDVLYKRLQQNCFKAREVLNWNEEEKKLLMFYKELFK